MKKRAQLLKQYLNEINSNNIDQEKARELENDPIDNFQISNYDISMSKVLLYKDLANFDTIEGLFGNEIMIFLLYQPLQGLMGHWVLLSKFGNTIEYFCSYGNKPDYPITHWYKDGQHLFLGELLSNRKDLYIVYNAFRFQKQSSDISTCGRWCVFRARANNLPLENFIDLNKALRAATKRPFDNLVSDLIPIA